MLEKHHIAQTLGGEGGHYNYKTTTQRVDAASRAYGRWTVAAWAFFGAKKQKALINYSKHRTLSVAHNIISLRQKHAIARPVVARALTLARQRYSQLGS